MVVVIVVSSLVGLVFIIAVAVAIAIVVVIIVASVVGCVIDFTFFQRFYSSQIQSVFR
jgi:hypothetical protein